jgi:MFS transporter, DHA2 family, methylenomycin A resistance protein
MIGGDIPMTFQFIAGDNAPRGRSVTNRKTVLLAQRLGLLLALRFNDIASDAVVPRRGTTNRTLVLLALCLGVLVAQIDTSVVNLATHAIGVTFQAGVAPLQWVLDAYNLVYAVLLLSGGLVADLYGRRRAFAIGAAVMAAGSLVCAFAPAIGVLIAARAVTGIGAALLLPSSLAIIRVVWPEPAARGRTLGIWASCNGLAFAVGPSIGGLLIEQFGWRSVFLLVVPIASAAFALAWLAVPESSDPEGRHFDLPGQVSGALALGGLALAAITGHDGGYQWIAALLLTALALPLFLWTERKRGDAALVPLDLFRIPAFSGAIAAAAAMTFGAYGMIFLLPLVWQADGHFTPGQAGFWMMPTALVFFAVSTQSGLRIAGHCRHPGRQPAVAGATRPAAHRDRHGVQHRAAARHRGRFGRAGALRHRVRADQCRADDRRHLGRRPARRGIRPAAWRGNRTARRDADRRAGTAHRRIGCVPSNPVSH